MLLGELARNERYYWPAFEVLCDFITRRSKGTRGESELDGLLPIYCPSEVQSSLHILADPGIRNLAWEGQWKLNISELNLRDVYLRYAELFRLCIEKSQFINADLLGSTFRDVDLSETEFSRCNFEGCTFQACTFRKTRFVACNLKRTVFLAPVELSKAAETEIIEQGGSVRFQKIEQSSD